MTAPTVAHLTTALVVVGGGMIAGHALAPYGAGAGAGRRVIFALVMVALGAWRGRREARVWAEWNDRPMRPGHGARAAAVGAVGALLLAAAGYGVAHG
ncbi:hypothetical protein tb265_24450 [Gemmatimonadetes bacterium T265]|nr:hypothetical protein tb265_24450 [Gemmatimonadetes bacterium T265]